ncbi:MAG: type II toxin-antitoxin system HicB family antitoxin [Ruminococcus sp.]|nr:type II toxin-antitoxin system HicB family antitoxin [Ruminococcus sp.]
MKNSYPIILTPDEIGYVVYIPDFDVGTEGDTLADAIEMAKDAIGLMGIVMEDDMKEIPAPTPIDKVKKNSLDDIITLVDVDFTEYRKKMPCN